MEGAPTGVDLLAILQQVLRHSDLPDEQCTVCRLLCTSRTVIDAVREHCTGRLPVAFNFYRLQQAQQFATWLKTHAKLLRSLDIQLAVAQSIAGPKTGAATNLIAEALQHAGKAHPAGLQLQVVKLQELHCSRQLLLQLQHSTQLTSLELQLCQRRSKGRTRSYRQLLRLQQQRKLYKMLVPALAGLTSLQRLHLHSNTPMEEVNNVVVLASALPALTQLTALQIDTAGCFANVLRAVPQQLLPPQPHLFPSSLRHWDGLLQLERLTSLTLLDNSHDVRETSYMRGSTRCYLASDKRLYCQMIVTESDRLPANLQVLVVADVRSARPFEQLMSLKKLVISSCTTSAADIKLLASYCGDLQDVQLWYETTADRDGIAAAWKYVPVSELHLKGSTVTAEVMQHIACLHSCLQCLDMGPYFYKLTAEQTAAALAQLTQLHTLQLELGYACARSVFSASSLAGQHGLEQQQDMEAASTGSVVFGAIASLPKLTNLTIECYEGPYLPWQEGPKPDFPLCDALLPLCDAVQITALRLARFGITDCVLQCLVRKLTELRSLSIISDWCFTPDCLAWIAVGLPYLERLDLTCTTITAGACHEQQLSGQLQGVQITASNFGVPFDQLPPETQLIYAATLGKQEVSHVQDIAD